MIKIIYNILICAFIHIDIDLLGLDDSISDILPSARQNNEDKFNAQHIQLEKHEETKSPYDFDFMVSPKVRIRPKRNL